MRCCIVSGNTARPAHGGALRHQLAQVAVGVVTLRHHFLGVFVAQFVQAELAQAGDAQRFLQQRGRVEPLQFIQRAQVLLAVAQAPPAQLRDAGVVVQRGEHIVQRLARGDVHAHIAAGHHGNIQLLRQSVQREVAPHLVVAQQVADAQPQTVLAQPLAVAGRRRDCVSSSPCGSQISRQRLR